ncbi:conjugative transposon protein TraK [Rufibacter sp. LB8]|uniref:conjugative transposon protein TraK n=1 Tax=Rufibacter sp. LB8 TaxID=2777781 RepID=UPI00178C52F0|nr:conjugative transposon protein TraK [Rufibacter sp. LB8]
MFNQLKNIDSAFRLVRSFCIALVACCLLITGFTVYKSHQLVRDSRERIYVLANGKALEAFSSFRKDNLPVEARNHVRMFHFYFFTLGPDEKAIQDHVSKALYLADESAKRQYDNLRESGFYTNLITANISQEITIDSVAVYTASYPFQFTCYATQRLVRSSSTLTRRLVTQGLLRDVPRSDHNPHGLLISRWETLQNDEIKP